MSFAHQLLPEKDSHDSTAQSDAQKTATARRRSSLPPAPPSNGISRWVFGGVPSFSNSPSATESRVDRYNLSATIRIPEPDHDSGATEPPTGTMAATDDGAASPAPLTELADGESAELPIYESSYPDDTESDSISSTLGYSPSVSVSPDEPKDKTDFGNTWGNHVKTASGGKIHKNGSTYEVTLTYENPIVIRVFKDTGPHSQVNIESATDPDIKAGNYPKVASDLTPNVDNRSPRGQFWARDLTLVHEQFHATDGQKFCKDAVAAEQKTLNTQTASSVAEVNTLLDPITNRIVQARGTGMTKPASEDRAYADGAKAYKARADKIAAQGKAGKYTASIEPLPTPDNGSALASEQAPASPEVSSSA